MKKQVINMLSMALMVLVLFSCDGGSEKKGSGGKWTIITKQGLLHPNSQDYINPGRYKLLPI